MFSVPSTTSVMLIQPPIIVLKELRESSKTEMLRDANLQQRTEEARVSQLTEKVP